MHSIAFDSVHWLVSLKTAGCIKPTYIETIYWDIRPCSPLNSTDVSKEYYASIFRVEEKILFLRNLG
jgi:hypothetical protein